MQIEPWLPPSILSLALWGVSVFLPKLALARLGTMSLTFYHTVFFFFAALGVLLFYGTLPGFHPTGAALAFVMGIVGTLGQLCLIIALRNGMMTYAVLISSLYPVVTLLLARVFLGETLTTQQSLGVVLAVASLALLVMAQDEK